MSPDNQHIAGLVASPEQPYARRNLLIAEKNGNILGYLPRIKDFTFSSDGKDIIASAEVITSGSPLYGIFIIKNYLSGQPESVQILTFPDYDQLPTSLVVSPDNQTLAYIHLSHVYDVSLSTENAQPRQLTTSGLLETNPTFSPDGNYLAFTHYAPNQCGRIYVIPLTGTSFPVTIHSGDDEKKGGDFPLQLKNSENLFPSTCNSTAMAWVD